MKSFKEYGPIITGNTQREIQFLNYFALTSRHWMIVDLIFIKLDYKKRYCNPHPYSVVMSSQQ